MTQPIDFPVSVGITQFWRKPIVAALAAEKNKPTTALDRNMPALCRTLADVDESIIEHLDDQKLIDLVKSRLCEHAVSVNLEKL